MNMDDDYQGHSGEDEELSGLTIHDSLGSVDGELDEADAWLASQGSDDLGGETKSYQSELYGVATVSTLQLGRISHVEPRVQAGIKALLMGQSIDGIHPIDAAAAREEFAEIIGGDPTAFAKQIKIDEAVQLPRHEHDLREVVSMLQNTAGEYLDRGPGGKLVNSHATAEGQDKADGDLLEAVGIVKELANLYIDPRTIGSSVEGARRRAVEEALTKRFIDGTFYDGSNNILPLPNETGVTGLVATQGIYGTAQGTAEDRLSASKFDDLYKQVVDGSGKTSFKRNENGYRIFRDDVSEGTRNDILQRTPSIQNSLFPNQKLERGKTYSLEELENFKRTRKHNYNQAKFKADKARRILRQQMPTTRDESKGQIRMSGWDAPYGAQPRKVNGKEVATYGVEQADLQNLRNEAAILGLEWSDTYAGQGEVKRGEVAKSSLTDFIEQASEVDDSDYIWNESKKDWVNPITNLTEKETITSGEIAQGTQAWLQQRKGKITASTAADLLREGGVDERALELALEKRGMFTPFHGNAHTREGSEGEAKAAAAFMAGAGKNLVMEEAYFEENENFPGFGVSPDGRLYDKEGNSNGLLELKYLSTGSMRGALNKYTPQMQMQMAITGEEQTHFYALDKYTGEYVHEVVKADSDVQTKLLEAGRDALDMADSLNDRGVQALRDKIESARPRQRSGANKGKGQSEAFSNNVEADEPAVAFSFRDDALAGKTGSSASAAKDTALAKKLMQLDQSAKMKVATQDINFQALGKIEVAAYEEDKKRTRDKEKAARDFSLLRVDADKEDARRTDDAERATRKIGLAEVSAYAERDKRLDDSEKATRKMGLAEVAAYAEEDKRKKDEREAADKEATKAAKDKAAADKEASDSVKNFGISVKNAAKVLAELGGLVTGGNASGMDEVRLAAETGQTTEQVRGTREALELGRLDKAGSNRVIMGASNLVKTFNDERTSAQKYTEIMQAAGASNLKEVRDMNLPNTPTAFQNLSPAQMTYKIAELMQGKSEEARAQIGSMFGVGDLAVYDKDPEALLNIDAAISEKNLSATNTGIVKYEQIKREILEEMGELGETAGFGGSVVNGLASVASSATAGYLAVKSSPLISKALKSSPKTTSMLKNVASVGKGLTPATAVTLAPMAARAIGDVKDDGSVADSALDVADFASYGAGIGGLAGTFVFPGVGTALGAGIGAVAGAGVGVANEAWEYFSSDDVLPSANIGSIPSQSSQKAGKDKGTVNVTVNNEISPDLVRTTTDVDGDLSVDEERGSLGTGAY